MTFGGTVSTHTVAVWLTLCCPTGLAATTSHECGPSASGSGGRSAVPVTGASGCPSTNSVYCTGPHWSRAADQPSDGWLVRAYWNDVLVAGAPGGTYSWATSIRVSAPLPWTQATAALPVTSPAATRPRAASLAPRSGSESTNSLLRTPPLSAYRIRISGEPSGPGSCCQAT